MNPPPPPSGGKSAEELRRSTLNMEKMIKKNVLAASGRAGGMKRGLAVVEFFKQQQQQQQQQTGPSAGGDDAEASAAKRAKKETNGAGAVATGAAPPRASASSLVGPPATPLIPKAAIASSMTSPTTSSAAASTAATAALLAAAAASHRGSPLRTSSAAAARASPLRQAAVRASPMRAVRASPLRQVFTSPSRRVTAPRLPEVTAAGVPPMHSTPVLNLDDTTAATPLKPPALPAKSPFQSFQSKFAAQSRGGTGVVKTPSPARPSPQPPARRASPMPQQLDSAVSTTTSTSTPKLPEVVDLSEEKATPTTNQRSATADASRVETPVPPPLKSAPSSLVMATPPPKPLARSLFSSASSVATKSLCFSTEGVASSLDVSPDGECIVVAFTDGSVRLYEMDSTVPSDRHGYLLGHLDEESNQSSAGAHLRVKISGDGRYAFVGCRSGPRVMMSVHLHNYRNGKDTEDEDMDQLQKSFHSNSRLRGFSDATICPSSVGVPASSTQSYYLLCGLGVGTMYMWQFIEAVQPGVEPEWRHLYSIPTNGNTVVIASFLPQAPDSSVLQIAGKCEDKNVRMWNLEPSTGDDGENAHTVQGHFDVPSSKDVISFYGSHAYGIAPTGEACRFRLPSQSTAVVRTYFDMERLDMGSSSKSRRANIILESIYASDDGKTIVAVSAEGIFYYTNQAPEEAAAEGGMLRIIGRNASLNAQYKSPMKVYKPVQADGALLGSVMAAVTNPQNEEDGEEGYVNVDTTEAWAARWMKPSLGQDCWVCGVRNIRHWQSESQVVRKPESTAASQGAGRASGSATRAPPRPSPSSKPPTSKPKPSASSDSSPGSPVHPSKPRGLLGDSARPTKPARSAADAPSAQKSSKAKPAPVKRLDVDGAAFASDDKPADGRSYVQQIEQELARYKERHTKIVTEWKRRLKGERQMRRLWKDREKEFEEQLHETFLKLDAAEQKIVTLVEAQKDAEKRFIFEKLKADQQSSVKVRYEQLCEQMQERMGALEHQQRVMEQTSRALLQEVDRHVQHSKQSVNGLVDRQQNECILCKDRAAVTAIVPCGHLCFCEEDADVYRRNFRGSDHVSCPVCQREMISMLRIY